ncbi:MULTISPECIES: roadblock/LC7 domain-containing protein [Micromonospora]|uniref:Predicted regulator of Ras-like GTPase activity, Roadblock/LC7/MglB family n=1 Tax=Micromonospora avicenniae TaxID=1198245 RepID=A0A1N6S593_9ACTN|nr:MULTISPECIES: roadblock/LC7 domain-containing protein [Micromonospora]TDC33007.1 roadblock/LC7 domain-containing protein [Micromonospora sp. 15K316]SIQ36275.1 Predicted regulator of Ras-like GTPase activity, Roadblock/LC7/MglB family [Micromonospora avicenniae]
MVQQQHRSSSDLAFLLDDLVGRVKQAEHAIVLSVDGLLIAASADLNRDDGEHLAAIASGIHSLAKGAGTRFGGGAVQQTIIELEKSFLLVTAAGYGACLAVLAAVDADLGLVAYEMTTLVDRAGKYLASPSRTPQTSARS